MSLIIMYILKCFDTIQQLIINQMEVDTFKYYQVKDLYKQMIVVSKDDTFPARFPNIFVDYPLGQMCVGDKLWTHWNKAPMRLWQTQLNFTVFCASTACGVSFQHLNYAKHPMIRAVYRFHVYYRVRRILKKLQVPLPQETSFNATDNPYTESEFLKFVKIMESLTTL